MYIQYIEVTTTFYQYLMGLVESTAIQIYTNNKIAGIVCLNTLIYSTTTRVRHCAIWKTKISIYCESYKKIIKLN